MPKILIIEDEPELVKVLRSYLEQGGYDVVTSFRGDTGLETWHSTHPDLVLLDLNLPGMDGLDVARSIRRNADTPIIIVTARVEEADRLIGLELGADDYVTKPYSPREVVARVKAVLRRANAAQQDDQILSVADLRIDLDGFAVNRGDETIDLTPTEFAILATLAGKPGRVYSRAQLLEASQDGEIFEGFERTVDAHIKNLRSKLGEDTKQPKYIETVFGVGYRFARSE